MSKLIVHPSHQLSGTFKPSGAKNAALPVLIASVLINDPIKISNVPQIQDVEYVMRILNHLGFHVSLENNVAELSHQKLLCNEIPYLLTKKTRASILFLSVMIARFKKIRIGMPGGCAIGIQGPRPTGFHLQALSQMGVCFKQQGDDLIANRESTHLQGADIKLTFPTVTGTENVILAGVLAKGVTLIRNAACEPEVVALADFLNQCGAKIEGAGTPTIKIEGVFDLHGTSFSIIPDRIEVGTFLAMVGATGGNLLVENCNPSHLFVILNFLKSLGAFVEIKHQTINLFVDRSKMKAKSFKALPYPYFPTDLQAQFLVLNTIFDGASIVEDCVFANRFHHVKELRKMGACITVRNNKAYVSGANQLKGLVVCASDLRASSSLVIAGLVAEGITTILNAYHLERGYENFCEKINLLGGKVERK